MRKIFFEVVSMGGKGPQVRQWGPGGGELGALGVTDLQWGGLQPVPGAELKLRAG
jgi:hypothetical protein